jgi:hypothetical protein
VKFIGYANARDNVRALRTSESRFPLVDPESMTANDPPGASRYGGQFMTPGKTKVVSIPCVSRVVVDCQRRQLTIQIVQYNVQNNGTRRSSLRQRTFDCYQPSNDPGSILGKTCALKPGTYQTMPRGREAIREVEN